MYMVSVNYLQYIGGGDEDLNFIYKIAEIVPIDDSFALLLPYEMCHHNIMRFAHINPK
jgi:hypothetical protein